ncbi:ATP-binding protein [Micromonospora sp. NPDC050397]|uniref:ATP-binding protein n=1 Tax=Micromonospora sp. NPDC050397 TaxID=3364279 RepID=UPI00384FE449
MRHFVGRQAQIEETFQLLASSDDGALLDLTGVHGIGKSSFLRRLAEESVPRRVRIFNPLLKSVGEGYIDDYGPHASAAVLRQTLEWSRQMLGGIAARLGDEFKRYRLVSEQQGKQTEDFLVQNQISLGARSTVTDVEMHSTVNISVEAVRDQLRRAQAAMDEEFVKAWTSYTSAGPALVTIDQFELIADDEMGHWVVRLAQQLPNTLVVVARTPSAHNFTSVGDRLHQRRLPNFTPAEVATYLDRHLGAYAVTAEVADVVYEFTEGHPGGVDLATRLISESDVSRRTASRLRREFARLPESVDARWADLVGMILRTVKDPVLDRAVEAAAVTTVFDEPMLADLLTEEDQQRVDASQAISALSAHALIQEVRSSSDDRSGRFRLHEFIRVSLGSRQRAVAPRRWEELHGRAAQHCFRVLQAWDDVGEDSDEDPVGAYGRWYRYENPEWQDYMREWLYHSAQLPGKPEVTFGRFVQVFLDAFWWWGYYHPFPFNRRLLEDWERTAVLWGSRSGKRTAFGRPQEDAQELAEALLFLLDHYPVGYLKNTDAPWDELFSKLLLVQELCGLAPGSRTRFSSTEAAELTRTNGLIKIFLAHTRRYADPGDPEADEYYDLAVEDFEDVADEWTIAWILFERADLAVERGLTAQARSLLADAAGRARELSEVDGEWDYELLASLHRVAADRYWLTGDRGAAAAQYAAAVTNAYRFQGSPHPPDGYTRRFYAEVTARTVDKIISLAASGELDSAVDFAMAARPLPVHAGGADRDGLRSILAATDRDALAEGLFPRGPEVEELDKRRSPFMDRMRRHLRHVGPPEGDLESLITTE